MGARYLNVVGIDPGQVHTGIVHIIINELARDIYIQHCVVVGMNPKQIASQVINMTSRMMWAHKHDEMVAIEAYRPRSNFGNDPIMLKGVADIHAALPGSQVLNNTGIKKVVTPALMHVLGLRRFASGSNHQDLQSAARIALLAALKNPTTNELLAQVVADLIVDLKSWSIQKREV